MASLIPPPRAKKSLGQHFLHDAGVARRIANLLEISQADVVLEIGPGPGALTRHLLDDAPRRLICLEKDRELAPRLKAAHPRLEIILMDALQAPWERIGNAFPGIKLAGNLPYNIASPLMWDSISQTQGCTCAVFMVQKEVGKRICAAPGSKVYGGLSVWLQAHGKVEYAFSVGPGAFSPPPKVDSAVIRFYPFSTSDKAFTSKHLGAVIKRCFQRRRKQLGTILKDYLTDDAQEALRGANISLQARPETLSIKNFLTLAKCLGPRIAP